jgi:hypothetical protein
MKIRRRHLVLLAVVLLIGAPIAWRYRPLNETERKLIGFWRDPNVLNVSAISLFHLTEDRRVDAAYGVRGSWSASRNQITVRFPRYATTGSSLSMVINNSLASIGLRTVTETLTVEFPAPHQVTIGGKTYVRSLQSWEEYTAPTEP